MKVWLTAEAKAHFPATPLLDFALAVEQITTRKKVPGIAGLFFFFLRMQVACILLDLTVSVVFSKHSSF